MIQSVGTDFGNAGYMRTDIKERSGQYLIEMECPGYNRENIQAQLEKGYLTIKALKNQEIADGGEDTRYILKERRFGEMKRTFYVGEEIRHEDISASLKDGILSIIIRKPELAVEGERRKLFEIQ